MQQLWNANRVSPSKRDGAEQEAAWIQASQNGDTAAFNQLVLKWETQVFNLAYRMLQDTEEAAEVCQEVFLSAYQSIGRFQHRARFSTWLYRIASNKCLTRRKQSPRRTEVSLEGGQGSTALRGLSLVQTQDQLLFQRESRRRILQALAGLPAQQRMVVEMRIYQDLKFDEIAAILDLPSSTVKSRFYASLQQLKEQLAPLAAGR